MALTPEESERLDCVRLLRAVFGDPAEHPEWTGEIASLNAEINQLELLEMWDDE